MVGHCFRKVYKNKMKEIVWWKYKVATEMKQVILVYLCILLFCIFRLLIFLTLNTQSGHWVNAGVWITVVAVVVDGVSCLVFGLVLWSFAWISTWYAAVVVSICLVFVNLLTYPLRVLASASFASYPSLDSIVAQVFS